MLRALMTLSGLTLVSRILGLVRDMMINRYLGVGASSDAWNAAFQLPNLFRRVFGEGAFNSAFIPLYSGKLSESKDSAFNYGNRVVFLLALVLAVLFVIFFIFLKPILWLCNLGFPPETLDQTIGLARVTLGYLFFVCLLAAFSAILNSHKKFAAPAISYVFLNVVFIIGMVSAIPYVGEENTVWVLSWSLLFSGVVQLLIVIVPAWKLGFKLKIHVPKIDSDMKKLGLLMIPGVISAGVQQTNLLVSGSIASFQVGAKSLIYNADRINQLPLGLIGIAFGVVLLPEISRKVKEKNIIGAQKSLQDGMQMAMLLALPAMIGIGILGVPIVDILFNSGKFTFNDSVMVGQALLAFSIGCPAYIMVRVVQPGYFAREDTRTPMRYTFISAGVNIVLCLVAWLLMGNGLEVLSNKIGLNLKFMEPLYGGNSLHVGCAAATTVAGWLNVILLIRGLRSSGYISVSREFWHKIIKMLISSMIMGIVIWFAMELLHEQLFEGWKLLRAIVLGLIVSTGVVSYFLVAHMIGAANFSEIKAGFKR
ncbi:MAG: putative peptidoglycan lipid II flippase [Rubritalea sp.]|jgi:putative peptidoglycan lipid II flippase